MLEPSSYRDPSGVVFRREGIFYRQINREFADAWERYRQSGLYDTLTRTGLLIRHEEAAGIAAVDDRAMLVIRPDQLDFVSYPYEWCFSQLKDAALATLRIQELALDAGMTLKDASAYNIQFVDGRPILIDSLSFEPLVADEPWVAYRQFCGHFLAPLALMAYADVRLGGLMASFGDGLPLDLATALLPWRTRLRPGPATHLHLHSRAQRRSPNIAPGGHARKPRVSPLGRRALLDSLRRTVEGLNWTPGGTTWSSYTTRVSYSATAAESKATLVREMLSAAGPGRVWDVGSNDGDFSAIAASMGRPVIAIDADYGAVEKLYLAVRSGQMAGVFPLVVDIANPSPASGWALTERRSLIQRGPAPTVLALALVHHLAIGANVPLPRLSEMFASIASDLVVEFVPKSDPQTASLLAARRDIFPGYDTDGFREAFSREFELVREAPIADSQRVLFHMRSRGL